MHKEIPVSAISTCFPEPVKICATHFICQNHGLQIFGLISQFFILEFSVFFFEIIFQETLSNFFLSWYLINQNFEVFSGLQPITTTQIVKLENENRDLTAKLRKTRLMLNDNTTRSSGSTLNSTILPLYNPGLIRILIRDI